MKKNQEKLYPHVPSLCNDCQNFNCICHVLIEMQQEEAKNSKFQPSEKLNSERIDIESTRKSTLPPSKSCLPKMFKMFKMFWLSLLIGCLCVIVAFLVFFMIYFIFFIGVPSILNTNRTKISVNDFGSKYRYLLFSRQIFQFDGPIPIFWFG